jgi:hypothetical protein
VARRRTTASQLGIRGLRAGRNLCSPIPRHVRNRVAVTDDEDVSAVDPLGPATRDNVVLSVDRALPEVFGCLLHRCGDRTLAEDLTVDTILSAIARLIASQRRPASIDARREGY